MYCDELFRAIHLGCLCRMEFTRVSLISVEYKLKRGNSVPHGRPWSILFLPPCSFPVITSQKHQKSLSICQKSCSEAGNHTAECEKKMYVYMLKGTSGHGIDWVAYMGPCLSQGRISTTFIFFILGNNINVPRNSSTHMGLTQWGLVRPIIITEVCQYWFRLWLVDWWHQTMT